MAFYLTILNAYFDSWKLKIKFLKGVVWALMCECISNSNFQVLFYFPRGVICSKKKKGIIFIQWMMKMVRNLHKAPILKTEGNLKVAISFFTKRISLRSMNGGFFLLMQVDYMWGVGCYWSVQDTSKKTCLILHLPSMSWFSRVHLGEIKICIEAWERKCFLLCHSSG